MAVKSDKQQEEMIAKQAQAYFNKAAQRPIWRRLQQRRNGQSYLPTLPAVPSQGEATVTQTIVNIADIVGSLNPGRAQDFDAEFRPRNRHTEVRWQAVAQQLLNGRGLPPVELVQTSLGYYVSDGHHRVSVYKAVGRDQIRAVVVRC